MASKRRSSGLDITNFFAKKPRTDCEHDAQVSEERLTVSSNISDQTISAVVPVDDQRAAQSAETALLNDIGSWTSEMSRGCRHSKELVHFRISGIQILDLYFRRLEDGI